MSEKYNDVAAEIVKLVGGVDNINALTHCVTRLRFVLKDPSKADKEALARVQYVLKVLESGGQTQVVVGNKVTSIFETIMENFKIGVDNSAEVDLDTSEDKSLVATLMGTISGILVPTLGVLTTAGIVKGVAAFLALENIGVLDRNGGVFMILYALGDGFFYFLPIMLGFTAAKKFRANEFIGAALGAALVYPDMVNIAKNLEVAGTLFTDTSFQMTYYNTFLGIPVIMPGAGYTSSVFPVIITVFIASKIEKWCKSNINEMIQGILTPLITLVISVVVAYLVIGPVLNTVCGVISIIINGLFDIPVVGGLIAGAILGGGFGVLVMFGLHWVIIGMALQLIAMNGFDIIMACGGIGPMIGMFQGLAICWACRNNQKVRDLAIPATISQICGVGEPLMYSILIPIRKLFAVNIFGGCVGGAIIGALGTKMYMFGGSGLFGIFNYAGGGGLDDMYKYCIGVGIGGIATILATFWAYNDDEASKVLGNR